MAQVNEVKQRLDYIDLTQLTPVQYMISKFNSPCKQVRVLAPSSIILLFVGCKLLPGHCTKIGKQSTNQSIN